jgi:hypothetical protein
MTPKEKAETLVALMYDVDFWDDEDQPTMQHHHAIKCAIIAVDEILEINSVDKDFDLSNYWQEVKQEILEL